MENIIGNLLMTLTHRLNLVVDDKNKKIKIKTKMGENM